MLAQPAAARQAAQWAMQCCDASSKVFKPQVTEKALCYSVCGM